MSERSGRRGPSRKSALQWVDVLTTASIAPAAPRSTMDRGTFGAQGSMPARATARPRRSGRTDGRHHPENKPCVDDFLMVADAATMEC